MREIGFQLYTAREFGSVAELAPLLASYGYRAVEGYGALYSDVQALRGVLEEQGLAMPSGHFGLGDLADVDRACTVAQAMGMASIVCPNIDPQDRPRDNAGWCEFGRAINRTATEIRAAGFRFAWHNNEFEFFPTPEGDLPMRILLDEAPDMDWQFDVAWAIKGGSAPETWFDRYGPRIFSLHVKDFADRADASRPDGWCAVGEGVVDWWAINTVYESYCPKPLLVVEHEALVSLPDFAAKSLIEIRNW